MRRVAVIGSSGSGKTTLARALSVRLGLPHLELDAVFHQEHWVPLDTATFHARVRQHVAGERWVVDGNYVSRGAGPLVWDRADCIVWLDLPRHVVMAQLLPRTLRRLATRERLWNGNRERWRNLFDRRPEENILLWAWTRHAALRERYARCVEDGTWAGRQLFRLQSRRQVTRFVEEHAPSTASRSWVSAR